MSIEPTFKKRFWDTWRISQLEHELTSHYMVGEYVADFAHLPTMTIIEIDGPFQEALRSQVKQSGWQIIQVNKRDLEVDASRVVQRIAMQLTNKALYLQKKTVRQQESKNSASVASIKPAEPIVCKLCGRELPSYASIPLCRSCEERERIGREQTRIVSWAKELMCRDDWVVLDTETTGIGQDAEVVEIALIDSRGASLLNTLVKPTQPIPADASRIHGIYDQDVLQAPSFLELWPTLVDYLHKYILLAYNVEFDLRVLHQTAQRYAIAFPQGLQSACIMQRYAAYERADLHAPVQPFSLQKVCARLSLQPGEHRALGDAQAAYQVLKKLSEKEL